MGRRQERAERRAARIAFAEAVLVFEGWILEGADRRRDYAEDRYVAVGVANGVELDVVYTERNADTVRIISARRATTHERKAYWEAFSA